MAGVPGRSGAGGAGSARRADEPGARRAQPCRGAGGGAARVPGTNVALRLGRARPSGRVHDAGGGRYGYDPFGRRVWKVRRDVPFADGSVGT